MKKASKRIYHVRCIRNLHVDSKIISVFYIAIVSSVVTYVIPSWFNSSSVKQRKDMKKLKKKVCKMVNIECRSLIDDPKLVCDRKSRCMMKKIMSNCSHPLFQHFKLLPHGSRPYFRTTRYKSTFVPKLLISNSSQ